MKNCIDPRCGKPNVDEARLCGKCGAPFSADAKMRSSPEPAGLAKLEAAASGLLCLIALYECWSSRRFGTTSVGPVWGAVAGVLAWSSLEHAWRARGLARGRPQREPVRLGNRLGLYLIWFFCLAMIFSGASINAYDTDAMGPPLMGIFFVAAGAAYAYRSLAATIRAFLLYLFLFLLIQFYVPRLTAKERQQGQAAAAHSSLAK